MKNKCWIGILIVVFASAIIISTSQKSSKSKDEWHNKDGTEIVCRAYGCGNRPVYPEWDNRFCSDHLDRSINHSSEFNYSTAKKKYNTRKALSREEAEALRGTGYNGTRPYSSAENTELNAAMRTCPNCGMYADRGTHNLCVACQYNKDHGLD